MSAATASSTDAAIVYVRLLDEGVDVWRPVKAQRIGATTYRLSENPAPEDEIWSFQPGDIVVVELQDDAEDRLMAVALATSFDAPSWAHRRKVG